MTMLLKEQFMGFFTKIALKSSIFDENQKNFTKIIFLLDKNIFLMINKRKIIFFI